MVTALSSHARGRRLSGGKVLRMAGAFLAGSVTMTLLILSLMGYLASGFHDQLTTATAWSVVSALLVGVGLVIWLTYYRRGDGTSLWISRGFAHFLHQRISRTTLATEAYSLGLVSVITEGVFIAIPALAAAMALAVLPFGAAGRYRPIHHGGIAQHCHRNSTHWQRTPVESYSALARAQQAFSAILSWHRFARPGVLSVRQPSC